MNIKGKTLLSLSSTILTWLIVVFVGLVSGLLLLSKFNSPIGIRVFYVESGSMEPAISTGSMVVVRQDNNYQVGDIVTAQPPDGTKVTVTHRVFEVITNDESESKSFRLKGDANNDPDRLVIPENRIVGKVLFQVPIVGRLIGFAQSQIGFMLVVIMPATILAYNEVMTIQNEVQKLLKNKNHSEMPKEVTS